MAKKESTEEKKSNPKENYNGFIKDYALWLEAQRYAENVSSDDARKRNVARQYAIGHANENMPAYSGIMGRPLVIADILRDGSAVDRILDHAVAYHGALASGRYSEDKKDIINEASEKGLAAMVLDSIPAVKIEGKDFQEASKNHANYQALRAQLPKSDDSGIIDHRKMNHAAVLNVVNSHVIERTTEVLSQNKYLTKDKKSFDALLNKSLDAAIFTAASSSAACLHVAESMLDTYVTGFNKNLPSDAKKAEYSREILRKLDNDMAMRIIFKAQEIDDQLKNIAEQQKSQKKAKKK